jgi:phosphoserine aminotransferase
MTLPKPRSNLFGSGPSRKRPGWTPAALSGALLGRSHRSPEALAKNNELIALTRSIIGIPDDYAVIITPGSDTGAMEMAMWSLLGPRGADVVVFDRFGELWQHDIAHELRLADCRVLSAPPGCLPDLTQADPARDIVFCWNGTTTGVCVPDGDWIDTHRAGLTICDATSAAFAYDLPWDKLDVTTYSWQKVLGGEAAHGMIVLAPQAVARLESYTPPWPMPRLFRLLKDKKLNPEFAAGHTINTPSLLCIEDCIDALRWIKGNGGLAGMQARSRRSLALVEKWVTASAWAEFMVDDPKARSMTAITLKPKAVVGEKARQLCAGIAQHLGQNGIAHDIMGHREALPSLRLWAGGMVDPQDIADLLPWIDEAYTLVYPRL